MAKTFAVHVGFHPVPHLLKCPYLLHPSIVPVTELIPKGATILHRMVPGNMVKPEQQLIRAGCRVVERLTQRCTVLRHRIAACGAAVEPDPLFTGIVVIGWQPVGTSTGDITPGLRAVVVIPGEDMVQSEWHHVVD